MGYWLKWLLTLEVRKSRPVCFEGTRAGGQAVNGRGRRPRRLDVATPKLTKLAFDYRINVTLV